MSDLDYTVGLSGTQFDRGAKQIEGRSGQLRGRLRGDFQTSGNAVIGFGRKITATAGVVTAAAATITAAVGFVTKEIGALAAQAETAGVSFEAFQELKFAAEQNLIGVDALTDGLKEMQLRLDEAITTGGGTATESLARLGFTAEELSEKLKDPPALFEEIIDRVKQLDDAAQVRVLDELFGGTAGEQFMRLMDEAEGSLTRQRERARELGIVLDQDYLDTVEEINRQWQIMSTYIGTNVKRAVIEVVNATIGLLDRLRQVESRSLSTLETQSVNLAKQRLDLENKVLDLQDKRRSASGFFANQIRSNADYNIKILETDRERLGVLEAQVDAEIRRRRAASEIEPTPSVPFTPTEVSTAFPTSGGGSGGGGEGGSRSRAADEAQRLRETVQDLIADLQFEEAQLGRTAIQQEIYSNLKRAGVTIESEYGQKIAETTVRLNLQQQVTKNLEEAQRAQADSLDYVFGRIESGLGALISGSEDASKVVLKLAADLALAFLRAQLLGNGPLAGLFGGGGGLFSGISAGPSALVSGAISSGAAGLFHGGTESVGRGHSRTKLLTPEMIASAPRFHNGTLAADEFPAVLRRGELVDPGDGSVARKRFGMGTIDNRKTIHVGGNVSQADIAALRQAIAEQDANLVERLADAIPEARRLSLIDF